MTHHRVNMQRVTKKLRRMTAPASIQKNGFAMPNGTRDEDFIHIDDVDVDADGSSYLYVPYRKRSSQSIFDESDGDGDDSTQRLYSPSDRHSYHDPNIIRRSKLTVAESPTEEQQGKDGKNPFSFKAFIKKEKRKAVYYSSREQLDSSGMEEEDWTEDMGNQNGTAPSGGAAPEVSNANSGTTSNGTSGGGSSSNGSSSNGRTNQRRATSPGMPNRAGRKGARSVQSTAGGTPAPPPPTKPTHMKSSNPQPPPPQHPHQQQQQALNAQNQAKGNEFVDFIYDYATKENGDGGEVNGKSGEESTNKKNKSFDAVVAGDLAGHREHVDKKQGRGERARAHTHGHAARKHKSPASKPNTKSTLVVDYIDASQNQSYSTSNLTVPDAGNDSGHQFDEFTRPKAATESKPHRERARAQSHGHRKKGSSDSKSPSKHKGTSSSSDTSDREHIVNLLAVPPKPAKPTENGHRSKLSASTNELDDTSRDDNRSHENLVDISVDSSVSEKISDKSKRDTPPKSSTPPPGDSSENGVGSSDAARLRQENSRLRKELSDARKASDKDSKKIESMEAEIKKLKLREAEDAKTLETMVQHVEANLKRTTERAVTAENTITKLKAEIKQLKGELGGSSSGKQKTEENKDLKDIKEKANAASLKLATAAKEAETNIKQLMSGVDVLKVLAETLACIDRISEDKSDKPKSFGTAL